MRMSQPSALASRAAVRSLSMTASTPRRLPSASRTTGMPPPPAATTTWPDSTSARIAPRSRISIGLGRGDDAAPALVAAVLPLLAVLDHLLRLVGGQVATDRLGRLDGSAGRPRRRACASRGRRPGGPRPRRASAGSRASRMVNPIVPCVWAPHQSSGTGGTTWAATSFLTSRLPTCGPLPWVSTTSCPAATSSATCSIASLIARTWSAGCAEPSGASWRSRRVPRELARSHLPDRPAHPVGMPLPRA